ncbi:MAG TPA: hypothetical protein VM658_14255 [bacterium]|nr:hypothetical protein [bacterium]
MKRTIQALLICILVSFLILAKSPSKPYGCYKDLKWGMTQEQVKSSLKVEMECINKEDHSSCRATKLVNAGGTLFDLDVIFNKEGLYKVVIDLPISRLEDVPVSCSRQAQMRIDGFDAFKNALTEKFGKPTTDSSDDRGKNLDIAESLCNRQLKKILIWKTNESDIKLWLECTARFMVADREIVGWAPVLSYEKKSDQEEPEKADL